MKTVKVLILALLVFSCGNAMAQKFASVKQGDIMQKLMEKDSTQQKLEAFYKELSDVADAMQQEYTTKLNDFQKGASTFSEAVRTQKEKDLQRITQNIEEFQQSAQQSIQNKRTELMTPLFKKFQEAAAKVGKEGSFAMIFDADQQVYVNETIIVDITELVRKTLGITK